MREVWLSEWIYTSNQLSGSELTLNDVLTILKDQYILDKTIEDHMTVKNHEDVILYLEKSITNKESLNIDKIWTIHNILSLEEEEHYRQKNPVLQHFQYVPPHFREVEDLMNKLIKWYETEANEMNPILRATLLHIKFIEIYPFNKGSEKIARTLLNYELLKSGLPPIGFDISKNEYCKLVSQYLKKQDYMEFYEIICKKVYLRLELFLRLTNEQN